MYIEMYKHQSFWNWGPFSSPAECQEFLDYKLHIKVTVLYV